MQSLPLSRLKSPLRIRESTQQKVGRGSPGDDRMGFRAEGIGREQRVFDSAERAF